MASSSDRHQRSTQYHTQPTPAQHAQAVLDCLSDAGLILPDRSVFLNSPPAGKGRVSVKVMRQTDFASSS